MSTPPAPARRTFGRVLLSGLASAGLAAVASSQTWLAASGDAAGARVSARISGSDAEPLGLALALVALATWGVLLVSGPVVRRAASLVGMLAAAGTVAVVVVGWSHGDEVAARVLADQGARSVADLSHVGWYWVTGIAASVQALVFAAAFRLAPSWPTMSSRYDAPGAASAAGAGDDAVPADDLELWKALDSGLDPTDRPSTETP